MSLCNDTLKYIADHYFYMLFETPFKVAQLIANLKCSH